MAAVSCMISSHDTEGTRPRRDIEVKCRGTLIPRASDFGSMRAGVFVVAKERLLLAVSPLGDLVRETKDHDTCQSGHITEANQYPERPAND